MGHDDMDRLLDRAAEEDGPVVWLTGAGISAESGIPTFRGKEGYWTVGSRNFHPMELATFEAFSQMPDEVWAWYLYRRGVCRGAEPNAAHRALVEHENALGDRFLLITQNVDGLHTRAGSSEARTYTIHGNVDRMRCADDCSPGSVPIPDGVDVRWDKGRALGDAERGLLVCPRCGGRSRPHVLWFDEYYDEALFHFESSIRAATRAALLIVIGTSGSTNLPMQVGGIVAQRGAPMIVINRDESPFSRFAERSERGWFAHGTAGEHLPPMVEHLIARATR